jgi:hypothetical protein
MNGQKSVIGAAVLCALVFGAIAAANASAEQKAFKCTAGQGVADYNDEHCVTKVTPGTGSRGHTEISNGVATAVKATNAKTASETTAARVSKLTGTIVGTVVEIQCTGVSGTGELTNAAISVTGNGALEYTGCTVIKPVRECVITGGKITTQKLVVTTVGQAANTVKVSPFTGTQLASVSIEKCLENHPPTNVYPVTGSLIASTSGATVTTAEATITAQATLKLAGNKAGLDGAVTVTDNSGVPVTLT